jgi:hypothetical protein
MAPFGRKRDSTGAEQAAQATFDWAQSVSPADVAAQLMGAFGPEGRQIIDTVRLAHWLLFGTFDLHPSGGLITETACVVEEAAQLLEHAELLRHVGDNCWRVNRLGMAALSQGTAAVRQRIKDRTGF